MRVSVRVRMIVPVSVLDSFFSTAALGLDSNMIRPPVTEGEKNAGLTTHSHPAGGADGRCNIHIVTWNEEMKYDRHINTVLVPPTSCNVTSGFAKLTPAQGRQC